MFAYKKKHTKSDTHTQKTKGENCEKRAYEKLERICRAGGEENEPSRATEHGKLTSICMRVCEKKLFSVFLNRFQLCESLFENCVQLPVGSRKAVDKTF